jgi:hypothetical protein
MAAAAASGGRGIPLFSFYFLFSPNKAPTVINNMANSKKGKKKGGIVQHTRNNCLLQMLSRDGMAQYTRI